MAMAASIVALLCATVFLKPLSDGARLAEYRNEITEVLTSVEAMTQPLEFKSADVSALENWLSTQAGSASIAIPATLRSETGIGCTALGWKGREVVIACFRLSTGEVVHFAVIDRDALRDSPSPGTVHYAEVQAMNTATWTHGPHTYVLASRADETRLHELLKI